MLNNIKKYLLNQADKMTAWIGVIGLALLFLGLSSFLFMLFIALIVLPEGKFSNLFKGWTQELRDMDKKQ